MYHKMLTINNTDFYIEVNIEGNTDPGRTTEGNVGQLYYNKTTKKYFKCVSDTGGVYVWERLTEDIPTYAIAYDSSTGRLTLVVNGIASPENSVMLPQFGSPLKAATAAAMTDTAKVYVYTGSETGYTAGHWYYHNGTAWTDGGVYNSAAVVTDKTLLADGVPADAEATGKAVENLKIMLGIQDDRTNELFGFLNYGYDTPADLPKNTSYASQKVAVKRNGIDVWLDGNPNSAQFVCKINNDVQRAASNSSIAAVTNGTVFPSGHTYRITITKISGSGTYNNADYIPMITVAKAGTSTGLGTKTDIPNGSYREFTSDGSEYMIYIYCQKDSVITNMHVRVTMQDMEDKSITAYAQNTKDDLISISNRINAIHNLVNYGYADEDVVGDPTDVVRNRISVSRRNTQITLNLPSGASTEAIRVKVSGDIARGASNSDADAWTTGVTLIDGHQYRASMTLISGTVTGDDMPTLSVYTVGTHATIGSGEISGNTYYREFTASSSAVNLVAYIFPGTVMTDAVYQIVLEDLTDGSTYVVAEGTAWN